jgi:methylenetetrahydrofolate dehydrogenase (NADP+)/methenyltetrahydrofolate cyclohydrolase
LAVEATRANILDGRAVSSSIRRQVAERAARLRSCGVVPRLEAIVAVDDPASVAYVRMKRRWADEAGIETGRYEVRHGDPCDRVIEHVWRLNQDPRVHGVLIQHPLPKSANEQAVVAALDPAKDVDGVTPTSLGRLAAGAPGFRCATPLGIMTLLDHYGIECEGRRALVVGRSAILGKPAALMLLERNATVTIAHSRTVGLPGLVRTADILVAAVGKAELIQGEWIKPGAIVVDAGYNKVEGRQGDVGDCHFESCARVASWITPVPGGVGPMTVASLLVNTVTAAELLSG